MASPLQPRTNGCWPPSMVKPPTTPMLIERWVHSALRKCLIAVMHATAQCDQYLVRKPTNTKTVATTTATFYHTSVESSGFGSGETRLRRRIAFSSEVRFYKLVIYAQSGESPHLRRLMSCADYHSVCCTIRLRNGLVWMIPIVPDVTQESAQYISAGVFCPARLRKGHAWRSTCGLRNRHHPSPLFVRLGL